MQYFERDSKYNWVDEKNVLLGYDSTQDCCEHADWYLASKVELNPDTSKPLEKELDWEKWRFDTSFFESGSFQNDSSSGVAVFRLLKKRSNKVMYLHLFNSHNGYYGHGFEFTVPSGKGSQAGTL